MTVHPTIRRTSVTRGPRRRPDSPCSHRYSPRVQAPTARSRQAVCRGPLIRLPGGAIGVRRLPVVAQAARGALRDPRCEPLCAWSSFPVVVPGSANHRQCALGALPGQLIPRLTAQLTVGRHEPVTRAINARCGLSRRCCRAAVRSLAVLDARFGGFRFLLLFVRPAERPVGAAHHAAEKLMLCGDELIG